jgi:hypothetical protein
VGQGFDGLKLENERLRAEIAALKAQLAEALGAPAPGEPSAAPPAPAAKTIHSEVKSFSEKAPGGNVVPLKPPALAAPAAPEEEYETVVVTEAVLGQPEAWRGFARDVDGMPVSGRGKYWGPVR